ncbi:hypothetical protein [Sphingobacterium rhinopitheci]|uniref:hypothetical protein n=1 Tax=Sphingobacterium rhinopitheci TaxID=2781960 RepID=UPI001F51E4C3|nr:hypothetical protein [Sphingobacterium rhinopitheci]MCI0922406.1 hypothetical protein [Sphingobacterium rhinopitheci]
MKKIKNYAMALVALVIAIGSMTLMSFTKKESLLAPVTIYFHGDSSNPAEVADESFWNDQPNGLTCNTGSTRACAMIVEQTDLSPSPENPSIQELDPSKFQLSAQLTTPNNYIPNKSGGSSSTPLNAQNRN